MIIERSAERTSSSMAQIQQAYERWFNKGQELANTIMITGSKVE
jgi:hypothetical protein